MDSVSFLGLMSETLQRDEPLTMDAALKDVAEWDSMAAMAILAMADRKFGKKITLAQLKMLMTVQDLYVLLLK